MESITTSDGEILSMAAMMFGSDISGSNHKSGLMAPSRSARKRTCCALSSAVTYREGPFAPPRSCKSNVLFPIPGSPPSNVTEPGTRPPPSTRSSSSIPVGTGSDSLGFTSPIGVARPGGTSARPAASETRDSSGPSTSSTSEFHAVQTEH